MVHDAGQQVMKWTKRVERTLLLLPPMFVWFNDAS
jgi:hypothetical protein